MTVYGGAAALPHVVEATAGPVRGRRTSMRSKVGLEEKLRDEALNDWFGAVFTTWSVGPPDPHWSAEGLAVVSRPGAIFGPDR